MKEAFEQLFCIFSKKSYETIITPLLHGIPMPDIRSVFPGTLSK